MEPFFGRVEISTEGFTHSKVKSVGVFPSIRFADVKVWSSLKKAKKKHEVRTLLA